MDIDLTKLKFKIVPNPFFIKISYKDEPLIIETPTMRMPYGVDFIKGSYYAKLQFKNYKNDKEMEHFLKMVIAIEKQLDTYLADNVEGAELTTELFFHLVYDPTLLVKFLPNKSRVLTKNGEDIPFIKLEKGTEVKCKLFLDAIWSTERGFYYKWKVLDVKVIS